MSGRVVLAETVVFPAELIVALLLMALVGLVVVAVTAWFLGVASARGSRAAWAVSSVAAVLWILLHSGQGWIMVTDPSLYTAPVVYAAGAWWGHHRRRTPMLLDQPPPPSPPGPPTSPPLGPTPPQ